MYILYFQHGEIGAGGWRLNDLKKQLPLIAFFYMRLRSSQIIINQWDHYILYKK